MNLVVDYGNSAAKVGIFDHQNLLEKLVLRSPEELRSYLTQSTATNVLVSSVKEDADEILSWTTQAKKKFKLDHQLPLPIANRYKTPNTLGVDRLAGVCGAQQLFPFQHCLVIDAGTCITYDFIDKDGNFLGGGISPGLAMRFKAVHTFTAKLPLISAKADVPLIGDSTETCIQSGVINGMVEEITGIIDRYRKKYEGLRVILCGGDSLFFENQLKASIFASPELVLVGLNSILNYNVTR
jgi:type III pantothenate kinase